MRDTHTHTHVSRFSHRIRLMAAFSFSEPSVLPYRPLAASSFLPAPDLHSEISSKTWRSAAAANSSDFHDPNRKCPSGFLLGAF